MTKLSLVVRVEDCDDLLKMIDGRVAALLQPAVAQYDALRRVVDADREQLEALRKTVQQQTHHLTALREDSDVAHKNLQRDHEQLEHCIRTAKQHREKLERIEAEAKTVHDQLDHFEQAALGRNEFSGAVMCVKQEIATLAQQILQNEKGLEETRKKVGDGEVREASKTAATQERMDSSLRAIEEKLAEAERRAEDVEKRASEAAKRADTVEKQFETTERHLAEELHHFRSAMEQSWDQVLKSTEENVGRTLDHGLEQAMGAVKQTRLTLQDELDRAVDKLRADLAQLEQRTANVQVEANLRAERLDLLEDSIAKKVTRKEVLDMASRSGVSTAVLSPPRSVDQYGAAMSPAPLEASPFWSGPASTSWNPRSSGTPQFATPDAHGGTIDRGPAISVSPQESTRRSASRDLRRVSTPESSAPTWAAHIR
eukprot:TRINITY_DN32202_c0_g1_i1.p1 TRINITY_DN32202_c0_g1~~TRINITY_DN32202_c0_g1_i1.p1  ORF type:complete len:428 (-),score=88.10 TRINITY_DN32202_c0_g1_i1:365-1648(-)